MLRKFSISVAIFVVVCMYTTDAQLNCAQYLIPADSMFNHPTEMPTLFTDSVITNLTLIHRESYYQCTEEKYGIHSNYKSWWLFKGCGGLFELNECLTDQTKTLQMKADLELTPEQMEIAQKSYQEFGKLKEMIEFNKDQNTAA